MALLQRLPAVATQLTVVSGRLARVTADHLEREPGLFGVENGGAHGTGESKDKQPPQHIEPLRGEQNPERLKRRIEVAADE